MVIINRKISGLFSCVIAVFIIFQTGCANYANISKTLTASTGERSAPDFTRDKSAIDYSGVKYTPWDVETAASGVEIGEIKPYTIMIYMNGSDLESENGAATKDLIEMLESGVDTNLVNIIIFTGGTYRWQNDAVPADDCVLWRIENRDIRKITGVGLRNMGDAGTLSSFIDFGLRCFPAERYGLILWDHGGGSIAGYGHDELFNESCLTLLEMDYAFHSSGLHSGMKLEFLGFDACLMATVEMAVVASDYARYLIASEDLEPGDGWDYTFLGELGADAGINGAGLGRHIADYYVNYYGNGTTDSVTMSVTDLAYASEVMGAMGELMERCTEGLLGDRQPSFTALAQRRYRTKTFGEGTRRDGDCDMVDIADMASRLADIYPEEAVRVLQSLGGAVVYNRHNSRSQLGGLTAYYIFGGKEDAQGSLGTYASLGMSGEYTDYLMTFAVLMNGGEVRTEGDLRDAIAVLDERAALWEQGDGDTLRMVGKRGEDELGSDSKWPVIGGRFVCLDKISETSAGAYYAVPVSINGEDADIIILFGGEYPRGVILGTRKEDGYIIQKGLDEINNGDSVSFYYRTARPGSERQEGWELSEPVTVKDRLELEWRKPDGAHYTCVLKTDIRHNERYYDFKTL